MPAEALWHEVGRRRKSVSIGELLELKRLFGVSVQALTYRCRDLGIFSQALYDRLFDAFKRGRLAHVALRGTEPRALCTPSRRRPSGVPRLRGRTSNSSGTG